MLSLSHVTGPPSFSLSPRHSLSRYFWISLLFPGPWCPPLTLSLTGGWWPLLCVLSSLPSSHGVAAVRQLEKQVVTVYTLYRVSRYEPVLYTQTLYTLDCTNCTLQDGTILNFSWASFYRWINDIQLQRNTICKSSRAWYYRLRL